MFLPRIRTAMLDDRYSARHSAMLAGQHLGDQSHEQIRGMRGAQGGRRMSPTTDKPFSSRSPELRPEPIACALLDLDVREALRRNVCTDILDNILRR